MLHNLNQFTEPSQRTRSIKIAPLGLASVIKGALLRRQGVRRSLDEFLRVLPTKWRTKVTKIEESKDLSTLSLDRLIGNLKVYEVILEKDLKISKNKKEKYKSLALKARKVLSEKEATSSDSNDEEYAMAVRDFKKFFGRRGKFVRQPHDDKRNFRKAKEDKKEKDDRRCFNEDDSKKEEICLMTLDDNEIRLEVKLEPDEWIKDSGCSRHMTGNKDLFSSYKTIDEGVFCEDKLKGA
ncbi:zf-CCHC domain-containing protein [Tanacetum coccineum]|uniref:Zf-CCHC domain-containing protein n=1 Tax=Tanacetum coccineum TaxID=301880 RepID=A0ABQ4Z2X1_9ASTR